MGMNYKQQIKQAIKDKFEKKTILCKKHNFPYTNYERRLLFYIKKVNEWVEPLGLIVKLENRKK